jgi:hypothetical protein
MVVPVPLPEPSLISVGDGAVTVDGTRLPVLRWWRPARPRVPELRGHVRGRATADLARRVPDLVGRGDGLTPYGDDVLCGALVALHAADPDLMTVLSGALQAIEIERRTTPLSAALLRHATDGWCIDELAAYLAALAGGRDVRATRARLLAVGHRSGAGLLEGVHQVLSVGGSEEAA